MDDNFKFIGGHEFIPADCDVTTIELPAYETVEPSEEQTRRYFEILAPGETQFAWAYMWPTGKPLPHGVSGKPERSMSGVQHTGKRQRNQAGYGVFVTVNETDGKGYKTANVARIRAVWADLDDGLPEASWPIEPSMVVNTSPGKFQVYWVLTADAVMTDEQFRAVMGVLVNQYGGDKNAKDKARVLRVPGFLHTKGAPQLVRIISPDEGGAIRRYSASEIVAAFPEIEASPRKSRRDETFAAVSAKLKRRLARGSAQFDLAFAEAALEHVSPDDREDWIKVGMALFHETGGASAARDLWDRWSQQSNKYRDGDTDAKWKGFGGYDGGATVGFGSIVVMARAAGFDDSGWRQPSRAMIKAGSAPVFTLPESDGAPPSEGIRIETFDMSRMQGTKWLWRDRLVHGRINVVYGPSGKGKSTLSSWIAAKVTTGEPWPGEAERRTPGRVLVLAGEETLHEDIGPRLLAAGGDPLLIGVAQQNTVRLKDGTAAIRTINMLADIAELKRRVLALGDVKLVIIDPLTSFMGNVDGNANSELRNVLTPLTKLAEECDLAVLIIAHVRKSSDGEALDRITGSNALQEVARSVMLFGTHPEDALVDDPRRVLASVKANKVRRPPRDVFKIVGAEVEKPGGETLSATRAEYLECDYSIDAEEILDARKNAKAKEKTNGKVDDVARWLVDKMEANVQYPAKTIIAAGEEMGFSRSSIYRARDTLKIKTVTHGADGKQAKQGFQAPVLWVLPPEHKKSWKEGRAVSVNIEKTL